jgi:2-haloacid dehalogenase
MRTAIAFDVYGTLVNPLAMANHLKSLVGDLAGRFAELWRTKQLEYSFRRGLMRAYQSFSVCTWEALLYTEKAFEVVLAEESRAMLMQHYKNLPPFPDALPGLTSLKSDGHLLAAFSNGEAEVVREVLEHAKVLPLLSIRKLNANVNSLFANRAAMISTTESQSPRLRRFDKPLRRFVH